MNTRTIPDPRTVRALFLTDTKVAVEELAALRHATAVSIDTEVVVKRDADGNIVKVDLDVPEAIGTWRVWSIAARFEKNGIVTDMAWVLDMKTVDACALAPLFADIRPWGWNANFDRAVLKRGGVFVRVWWDGMLCDALLRQGAYAGSEGVWYTSLEVAARRHLGIAGIEGKDDIRFSYDAHTPLTAAQIRYAADDAVTTLWLGFALMEQLEQAQLVSVADRSVRAQNCIHGFTRNGLPLDGAGYQAEIDQVKLEAARAGERLAVATTGRELLSTLVRWAAKAGHLSVIPSDTTEVGLRVLKDAKLWSQFLQSVDSQLESCQRRMSQLVGTGERVEDLFSDVERWSIPFDPDNATSIRRWLSKNASVFVAEYLAGLGATTRGLTVANKLDSVYAAMIDYQGSAVTTELRELALVLGAYSRYRRIQAAYAGTLGATQVWLQPEWTVGSADQVRAMLNEHSKDQVLAYTAAKEGTGRLLGKSDSVDAMTLKLMGGPVAEALLEYRKHDKIVSTYGDKLLQFINPITGRVHAKYTQELTGTGRLSSDKPNAQNLSPLAKPYIGVTSREGAGRLISRDPQGRCRVIVTADLSQAELRFMADMANDENMLNAFRNGEDLHERTASLMFGVDMQFLLANSDKTAAELRSFTAGLDEYAANDPAMKAGHLWKVLRKKAKAVGFGYAYGLKGRSLANQLTSDGVPTTKEEADGLLAAFDLAYPQLAAWMAARVEFIDSLARGMRSGQLAQDVDFEMSWRLHRIYHRAAQASKALKARLGYSPSNLEIAQALVSDDELTKKLAAKGLEVTAASLDEARLQQAAQIGWALGHFGSAVLMKDGTPWTFESRNVSGRRRLFQIGTDDWVWAMVESIVRSRRAYAQGARDAFVSQYNARLISDHAALVEAGKPARKPTLLSLTRNDPSKNREVALSRDELKKALEARELRVAFVTFVLAEYERLADPAAAKAALFREAMADRIRAMVNQYRNHPIQSGVADVMLEAFARIDVELSERFPTALVIQSVHDSLAVECDLKDAQAVREIVARHMEACLSEMCPRVPAKADALVQLNLDEKSALTDEMIEAFLEAENAAQPVAA